MESEELCGIPLFSRLAIKDGDSSIRRGTTAMREALLMVVMPFVRAPPPSHARVDGHYVCS